MRNAWGIGRIFQAEWLAYVKTLRKAKSMAFSGGKKKNASKVRVYLVRERVVQEKSGEAGRNLIMQNYVSKCNRMSSKCFTCLKFAFRVDIGV